jgi:hypothetical protein
VTGFVTSNLGIGTLEGLSPEALGQLYQDIADLIGKARTRAQEEVARQQLVKLLSNLTPSEHPVGAGLDQAIAGLAAKLQAALGINQGASATETQDQEDRDWGNWKDPDPSDTEDSNKVETSD